MEKQKIWEEYRQRIMTELELPFSSEDSDLNIPFSEDLTIELKKLNPGISFSAAIESCPTENREAFFMYLMKATLLGQGTGEGSLALSPDGKAVLFILALPFEMSFEIFREKLEDFVNFSLHWKKTVQEHREKSKNNFYHLT
jgi:hypothetical protein